MSHNGKIIFNATDLIPVIAEARKNHCCILLVKDRGLYMMSEDGDINTETGKRRVAYADGFNPDITEFEDWYYTLNSLCGGDDFAEYLNADDPVFDDVMNTHARIMVEFSQTTITLQTVVL